MGKPARKRTTKVATKKAATKRTAKKTTAAKKDAAKKAATKRKPPSWSRRTATAASPSRAGRSDDAHAFIPDPSEGGKPPTEDLAEILGEDFVRAATRGNEALEDDLDRTLPEELGGPFVMTSAREELAHDVDDSNPADAEPEAFPRANAGLVQRSPEELVGRALDKDVRDDEDDEEDEP